MRKLNEFEIKILWVVGVISTFIINGAIYNNYDILGLNYRDYSWVINYIIGGGITFMCIVAISIVAGIIYFGVIYPIIKSYKESYPKKVKKNVLEYDPSESYKQSIKQVSNYKQSLL